MNDLRTIKSRPSRSVVLSNFARRSVLNQLQYISYGHLTLLDAHTPGAIPNQWCFGNPADHRLSAQIEVTHPDFWMDTALGGSVGAAESFAYGHWQTPDLTALVRLMVRNRSALNALEGGLAFISSPLRRWFHALHRNSVKGSRKNIEAHYDLGNDFFKSFLDPTLAYSSAVYPHPEANLQSAQLHKFKTICEQLQLEPGMQVLEIGSGWGGLACYIAEHYGCHVTSITLSPAQREYCQQLIKTRGLADKVDVKLCDYRHITGQFDRVVSIEMIEAVGAEYLGLYLKTISDHLTPQGRAVIQMISIQDQLYEELLGSVDFIQRYIFPGSFIPSLTAFQNALTAHTDCRIFGVVDIGLHYAETLKQWRLQFKANQAHIESLGYSPEFCRMWEYYLCYCEGGFWERQLSDLQITFTKPYHQPKRW